MQAEEGVETVAACGALDDGDDAECSDDGEAVSEDVVEDGVLAGDEVSPGGQQCFHLPRFSGKVVAGTQA